MELDELRQAWQTVSRQLERQQALQGQLLREHRLERVRGQLRPLLWGQALQFLLGVSLVVLGVACWTRNTEVPGLLASGLLVHAFGLATAVMAALTIALAASIDYSAPVLRIQKRMAQLARLQACNSSVCGLPWWIMWLPVVLAFAGLGEVDPAAGTPMWIVASLVVSFAGLFATWGWAAWRRRRGKNVPAAGHHCAAADGSDGIRRGQRMLEELASFERD